MGVPVEPESLHAVMRVCLRLTRDYKIAVIFAHYGGVHMLLKLNQSSGFPGFLPLSNLLIRHVIEDPMCLKYAIEKVRWTSINEEIRIITRIFLLTHNFSVR